MFMYHGFYGFYGLHTFWLIGTIIAIIPLWRICDRVGLSPWLSLLLAVPLAGILVTYYVAFTAWPGPRGSAGSVPPGFGPGPGPGSGPTPT
jgi:hypothetical protein